MAARVDRVRTGLGFDIDTTTASADSHSIFVALVEFERELIEEQAPAR